MSAHVRKIKRVILKHRASLVVNLDANHRRFPCLIVDSSKSGFRLRGISRIKTGELVELLVEDSLHSHSSQRCRVAWVGKVGTKHAGDIGLEIA
jgi:PilZ domain